MPVTQEEVLTALKDCHDPKNSGQLVDLGLITMLPYPAVDATVRMSRLI